MNDENNNLNNVDPLHNEPLNSNNDTANIADKPTSDNHYHGLTYFPNTPQTDDIIDATPAIPALVTSDAKDDTVEDSSPSESLNAPKKKGKSKSKSSSKKATLALILVVSITAGSLSGAYVSKKYTENAIAQADFSQNEAQNVFKFSEDSNIAPNSNSGTISTQSAMDGATAVEKAIPSVVKIDVTIPSTSIFGSGNVSGSGSGIVCTQDNDKVYIITNNHVINDATSAKVLFDKASGPVDASLVGTEAGSDLAVISVLNEDLKSVGITNPVLAEFGDSSTLKVGNTVFAIGNALGEGVVPTGGWVSAVDKEVDIQGVKLNVIQTDAAINPGNSGGALINSYGQVIGINTAKLVESDIEGTGYAITINSAKPIIESILGNSEKPFLGISGITITEDIAAAYSLPSVGVFIKSTTPGSPAEKAGILENDIITSFDGQTVTDIETLSSLIKAKNVGDSVEIKVIRNIDSKNQHISLTAVLEKNQTNGF